MSHARLAPSSSGRRVHCPGSLIMSERFPQTGSSKAAEEGTASHWVAEQVLKSYQALGGRLVLPLSLIGKPAENGVIVTSEMTAGADLYIKDVLKIAQKHGALQALHIEERIDCESIHPEMWGTPDCWVYLPNVKTVILWDYKYGHRSVSPEDNWQLISYAAGIMDKIVEMPGAEPDVMFDMRIAQPRGYSSDGPIRSWVAHASALRAQVNRLSSSSHDALSADPSVQSGAHCLYCPALHACPSAKDAALHAVDIAQRATVDEIPAEAMGAEISMLRRAKEAIDLRLTAMESQAIHNLTHGVSVPGWTVREGQGRQAWSTPVAEVVALGSLMGIDLSKPGAITPKQAIKKGIDEAVISAYSETPSTGLKLVPDDGKLAKRVFGNE